MHPETHLATRDWRHLCRSPPCSPCFLHIKNLFVVLLDLFFTPVRPEDSQKTRPTAPWCSTISVQVSGHLPHLHVFFVETGNLESTIQQHLPFCLLEAAVHIANTQKLLNNQRWLSFCRAATSKGGLLQHVMSELFFFFFEKITFCRIPDGTRVTRPFVVWFPACVVEDRTLRKVVVSVRPTDVLVTCAR